MLFVRDFRVRCTDVFCEFFELFHYFIKFHGDFVDCVPQLGVCVDELLQRLGEFRKTRDESFAFVKFVLVNFLSKPDSVVWTAAIHLSNTHLLSLIKLINLL